MNIRAKCEIFARFSSENRRCLIYGLGLTSCGASDDDGDYVVFSSNDELRVAITNTTDNTLRIYIRGLRTCRV